MEEKQYYNKALIIAREGFLRDEVPVGCVVVKDNTVIISSHNKTNELNDPLAHAEYLCIKELIKRHEDIRKMTFYITIEPCAMCAGVLERCEAKVIFGYHNTIFGAKKILGKNVGKCINDEGAIEILKEFYKTPNKNTVHLLKK